MGALRIDREMDMEGLNKRLEDLEEAARDRHTEFVNSLTAGSKSSKLNNDQTGKLNATLDLVFEIIREQRNLLMYQKGQLQVWEMSQGRSSPSTYAEAAARDRKRSRSRKRVQNDKHVVAIYPRGDLTSDQTKEYIQKSISPNKIKVGVTMCKRINKGGIILGLEKPEDIEKIREEIRQREDLKEEFKVEVPKKREPQIIVFNVNNEYEEVEMLEKLKEQNLELEEAQISVITKYKTTRGTNWVFRLNGEAYQKLKNNGKVKLDWECYNFRDYVRPRICYKCWRYGHTAGVCREKDKICRRCGNKDHDFENCREEICCVNCKRTNEFSKSKLATNHSPTDRGCPKYGTEVERLKSQTFYG